MPDDKKKPKKIPIRRTPTGQQVEWQGRMVIYLRPYGDASSMIDIDGKVRPVPDSQLSQPSEKT